jgi:hypothetical protein
LSTWFTDTTSADFARGTSDGNTYVAETAGGEVTLRPDLGSEFTDTMPAGWVPTAARRRGGYRIEAGTLNLDRRQVATAATFAPGRTLEFVAQFQAEPDQQVGFTASGPAGERLWVMFATGSGGQLLATTMGRQQLVEAPLGTALLGSPHRYRIMWSASQVVFSVDGVPRASHAVEIGQPLQFFARDTTRGVGPLTLDWVRATPYAGSGTFRSRVLDAGAAVAWGAVSWAASRPAGSTVTVSVRTGDTPTPDDGTWTEFRTLAKGTAVAATARYLQYRVQATTSAADRTPVFKEFMVEATGGPLAIVQLEPGWGTFGQVLPQGAVHDGIQVGDLVTQTDVKTRWPDGSIRFAVVTADVVNAGTYELRAAATVPGTFAPQLALPAVRFDIGGTVYAAAATTGEFTDAWLDGPLVHEARATLAPVDGAGQPHPFLRVLFDVRSYADGQSRVDVTVENTLDIESARAVTYDVSITVGEQTLFAREDVTHWYLTRWRQVFDIGLDSSAVTPDFRSFYEAGALPRYLSSVANTVSSRAGANFDLLQIGDLEPYMPSHGGRPEIAPYPDWTARYLVHRGAVQREYVLAHGDLAGSWPMHIREADGRLISLDERPNFWLDRRADSDGRPRGDLDGTGPFTPDIAHQPSLAYVPYLLTGDRYYADEMRFWANYVLLGTFQDGFYNARRGAEGWLGGNEVRGIAWGLRNLADAAAYLPDNDPAKAYFSDKVANNLRGLDALADEHGTPLGTLWEDKRPENEFLAPQVWIATWEQNYLAWSIDHANRQGFDGGQRHRDRIVAFQARLFTSPEFDRRFAGAGVIAVGVQRDTAVQFYADTAELFRSNFSASDAATPFVGYYGVDARLALLMAIERRLPGARSAYDYLFQQIAVQPYVGGISDLAARAGWAIARNNEP